MSELNSKAGKLCLDEHYDRFNIPESWSFTQTHIKHVYLFMDKDTNTYFYDFLMDDENFSGFKYKNLEVCKYDFELFCKELG